MFRGNDKLVAEVSTSTDTARILDIISNTDDALVLRIAATNTSIDILAIEALSSKYLQELINNDALANATVIFGERVEAVFTKEADQISKLQISGDSQWWDWLIQHPFSEVRQATTTNPYLPGRLRPEIKNLDVACRLGFALNKTSEPFFLKPMINDSDPRIKSIIDARFVETREQDFDSTTVLTNVYSPKTLRTYQLAFGVLAALILFLMFFGDIWKFGSSISSNANKLTSPTVQPVIQIDYYDEAIALANKAILLSKTPGDQNRQKEVIALWDEAIKNLRKVDRQSANYQAAQSKISRYQVIRDVANRG
jgi:hypothetical protein